MAFQPGFKTRVVAGTTHLSCSVRDSSMSQPREVLEVTTLCDGPDKAFVPGKRQSGSFSASGPLDVASSTNEPWDVLTAWKGTKVPVTFMPEGDTAGSSAILIDGHQTDFGTSAAESGTVDFSISIEGTGQIGSGASVEPLAAITTTTTGSALDATAASSAGGVFHLHVTVWDSLTSNTVTVEDSADGSTDWQTIATFTAATGVTSERVVTSGAVRRYVRVVDTVVGSGSNTRSVAFARL